MGEHVLKGTQSRILPGYRPLPACLRLLRMTQIGPDLRVHLIALFRHSVIIPYRHIEIFEEVSMVS